MSPKKHDIPYSPFETFVFRAPLLPVSLLQEVYNIGIYNAIEPYQNIIEQALYLASPNIYRKYKRRLEGRLKEDELEFDLILLKYIVRMTSRCTPFGLFAGIGAGMLQDKNQIVLSDLCSHSTHTKLSQDFLYHYYEKLKMEPVFLQSSIYHINNTLYHKQSKIRYTEYEDNKGFRKYTLSAIENNDLLAAILEQCEKGITGEEIISNLKDEGIPDEEARTYLNILVDNKVIISDMEPCPVSDDMLEDFSKKVISRKGDIQKSQFLASLNKKLNELDNNGIGIPVKQYKDIGDTVNENSTFDKPDKVFHVDLGLSTKQSTLDIQIISSLYTGIDVLNRLTASNSERFMGQFRQKFYRKYENQEIPLIEALDSESGIPVEDKDRSDINPLIDDIRTSSEGDQNYVRITPQLQFLTEEYYQFLSNRKDENEREIVLDQEKIKNLPVNWNDLPLTFYVFAEIILQNDNPLIYLKGALGVSAANILARFHQTSPAINNLLIKIAHKEKKLQEDAAVAEIVHLPETRTGNVLLRPNVYDYEIPIVSTSQKDVQDQIPVTDLMISVPNGQSIMLRSEKLDKRVVPRLSSAQNFTKNSIPVYRFLCYLQMQGMRTDLSFTWDKLLENRPFLPRVRFENIILSPATWKFAPQDISQELSMKSSEFHGVLLAFKDKFHLPEKVLLAKGDNKLLIEFKYLKSCQLFYSEIRHKVFVLEEYIPDLGEALIKDEQDRPYSSEINFFFFRNP